MNKPNENQPVPPNVIYFARFLIHHVDGQQSTLYVDQQGFHHSSLDNVSPPGFFSHVHCCPEEFQSLTKANVVLTQIFGCVGQKHTGICPEHANLILCIQNICIYWP